jgi:hypothetical protein
MAFPTSPTNGQTYTVNGIIYVYSSTKTAWQIQSSGSATVPTTVGTNLSITGNFAASGTMSVTGNANVGNIGAARAVLSNIAATSTNISLLTGSRIVGVDTGSIVAPGTVLQVVNTLKADRFTTTSTSMTNITGLAATITPKFANSKILIMVFMGAAGTQQSNLDHGQLHDITRNGGACDFRGAADGSRTRAVMKGVGNAFNNDHMPGGYSMIGLDSPGSTEPQVYQVRVQCQTTAQFFIMNGNNTNTNGAEVYNARTCSTITLMEIAQ